MDKEAFDTILALNKKLEDTDNFDEFEKTIFGLLLFGGVKCVSPELVDKINFVEITKNISSEYKKEKRLILSEDYVLNRLRSFGKENLSEDDGIALCLAIIYSYLIESEEGIEHTEECIKRFLKDFNQIDSVYENTKNIEWSNDMNVLNKIIFIIRNGGKDKSPFDFNFEDTHPLMIFLNDEWSEFETIKRTKLHYITNLAQFKEYGFNEDTFKEYAKKFFNPILKRTEGIKDIRLDNIRKVYYGI